MQLLDQMDLSEEEQREKRIKDGKKGRSKAAPKKQQRGKKAGSKAAVKKEKSDTEGICYSSTAECFLWHSYGND
jgi:DNA topoisomerase-2